MGGIDNWIDRSNLEGDHEQAKKDANASGREIVREILRRQSPAQRAAELGVDEIAYSSFMNGEDVPEVREAIDDGIQSEGYN